MVASLGMKRECFWPKVHRSVQRQKRGDLTRGRRSRIDEELKLLDTKQRIELSEQASEEIANTKNLSKS